VSVFLLDQKKCWQGHYGQRIVPIEWKMANVAETEVPN